MPVKGKVKLRHPKKQTGDGRKFRKRRGPADGRFVAGKSRF